MGKEEKRSLRAEARKKRDEQDTIEAKREFKQCIVCFILSLVSVIFFFVGISIATSFSTESGNSWTDILFWASCLFFVIFIILLITCGKKILYGIVFIFSMIIARKDKNVPKTEEDKKWDKMWALWAEEKISDPIKYLLTYDNEIQNGGHEQYFDNYVYNKTEEERAQIFATLKELLSETLYENLRAAYETYAEALRFDQDVYAALEKYDDVYFADSFENEYVEKRLKAFASTVEILENE